MRRLFSVCMLMLLPLAGCGAGSGAEQLLEGSWNYTQDLGNGYSSTLTWTFERGRFRLEGYPPLFQEGRYRVLSATATELRLLLTEQSGNFGNDDKELAVQIDEATGTLIIDKKGPFHRVQ